MCLNKKKKITRVKKKNWAFSKTWGINDTVLKMNETVVNGQLLIAYIMIGESQPAKTLF